MQNRICPDKRFFLKLAEQLIDNTYLEREQGVGADGGVNCKIFGTTHHNHGTCYGQHQGQPILGNTPLFTESVAVCRPCFQMLVSVFVACNLVLKPRGLMFELCTDRSVARDTFSQLLE